MTAQTRLLRLQSELQGALEKLPGIVDPGQMNGYSEVVARIYRAMSYAEEAAEGCFDNDDDGGITVITTVYGADKLQQLFDSISKLYDRMEPEAPEVPTQPFPAEQPAEQQPAAGSADPGVVTHPITGMPIHVSAENPLP